MLHGAQIAVDITLRSATSSDGWSQSDAAHTNGAGNRCRLVVIALETGGRWSDEAVEIVDMLAGARAREVLPVLRQSSVRASGVATPVDAHVGGFHVRGLSPILWCNLVWTR